MSPPASRCFPVTIPVHTQSAAKYLKFLQDKVEAAKAQGFLVVDSLTQIIGMIGSHTSGNVASTTFKEGLRSIDILGVTILNKVCEHHNVTMVGLLNSKLFPRVEDLEGACEGSIVISVPGMLKIRDRSSREHAETEIPQASLDWAVKNLGYGKSFSWSHRAETVLSHRVRTATTEEGTN